MRSAILTFVSLIFLSPILLIAQEPQSGVIRGRVVDATDGSGIADADVYLLGSAIYGGRVATTEAGGYFTFLDLKPGKYSLRTYPDGFIASDSVEVVLDALASKDIVIRVQKPAANASFSGIVRDNRDR